MTVVILLHPVLAMGVLVAVVHWTLASTIQLNQVELVEMANNHL